MNIRNPGLFYKNGYISKQFKSTNLLERMKYNCRLKYNQLFANNDVVNISAKNKKY